MALCHGTRLQGLVTFAMEARLRDRDWKDHTRRRTAKASEHSRRCRREVHCNALFGSEPYGSDALTVHLRPNLPCVRVKPGEAGVLEDLSLT